MAGYSIEARVAELLAAAPPITDEQRTRAVAMLANAPSSVVSTGGSTSVARPTVERCALYRHYDEDGALLYIGITKNLPTRTHAHSIHSVWVDWVADSRAEWFASRKAAEQAEAIAIKEEQPLFNKTHNDYGSRELVEYLIKRGRTDLLVPIGRKD